MDDSLFIVHRRSLLSRFRSLGLCFRLGLLFEQRLDRKADSAAFEVQFSDLDINLLANRQNIGGLAHPLAGDLADVYQPIDAGNQLGKSAERGQRDDLDRNNLSNRVVVLQDGPRIILVLLIAKGDLLLLRINILDINIDHITDLDDLRRMLDLAP